MYDKYFKTTCKKVYLILGSFKNYMMTCVRSCNMYLMGHVVNP